MSEYHWPTGKEWKRLSIPERHQRANKLIEQAYRQRASDYKGPYTMAQGRAKDLFTTMNEAHGPPEKETDDE